MSHSLLIHLVLYISTTPRHHIHQCPGDSLLFKHSMRCPMAIDPKKLDAFMTKMVGEMGSAINATLILLGDKLGLYKAMAGSGPMTPAALAHKTGTHERMVREWLNAQA